MFSASFVARHVLGGCFKGSAHKLPSHPRSGSPPRLNKPTADRSGWNNARDAPPPDSKKRRQSLLSGREDG
jgi:hypothetical protein